jgi:hypothetical protein
MSLSETQVGGLVRSLMRKYEGRMKPVFGIRSQAPWSGPEELTIDGKRCRVVQVNSPLQAREEIFGQRDDRLLVLVTGLQESALGSEVLARMAPPTLQAIHPWASVKERFGAARLDPRVTQYPWLAEALLALSDDACKPVTGGVLDLNHALGSLLRGLGLSGPQPTEEELLVWASSGTVQQGWSGLSQVARAALRDTCSLGANDIADRLFDAVEHGAAHDLIALSLALDVLSVPEAALDPRATAARVRAERYFGPGKPLDVDTCRAFGRVARTHVEKLATHSRTAVDALVRRAEAILKDELLAGELVEWSDFLPGAVTARQGAFSTALAKALRQRSPAALEAAHGAAERLRTHRFLKPGDFGGLRSEMALRLVRWIATPALEVARSLELAGLGYLREGVWVDRARHELLDGESHPDLRRIYAEILSEARGRREVETGHFAERLARTTEAGPLPTGVIGIEDILSDVVAPLASMQRTLIVVLDGMSRANLLELVRSIESHHGFRRHLPVEKERWPLVLSVLPSVTEASRCSLLSGKIAVGGQAEELNGFHDVARQKGWHRTAGDNLLFHRADLMADNVGRMEGALEKAVFGSVEVVAVVINAIDDQLTKGDQIRPVRSVEDIRPLERLIGAAKLANRVVVLTCDHGHVVEEASADPKVAGERERWRSPDRAAEAGEVLVRGSRVALPTRGGPCVLAASETVRYVSRRGGYHGGASPQEVLISLAVLVPSGIELKGWKVEVEPEPTWWSDGAAAIQVLPVAAPERPTTKPAQPSLFDSKPAAAPVGVAWIDGLLASPMFASQKKLAGRSPLKDAELQALIECLAHRGWTATPPALASVLSVNAVQLNVRLAAARRLLNVEGYPVLDVDEASSTVKLNIELLAEQFGIQIR